MKYQKALGDPATKSGKTSSNETKNIELVVDSTKETTICKKLRDAVNIKLYLN